MADHHLDVEDSIRTGGILGLEDVESHIVNRNSAGSFAIRGTVVCMSMEYEVGAVSVGNLGQS